jgi:hypothetical protein
MRSFFTFTPLIRIVAALVICAASFWITLQSLDYWDGKDPFANVDVTTAAAFERTAPSVGFTKSNNIASFVEIARRRPTGELEIVGWAFDREDTGNPVSIYIFMSGRLVLRAEANGPRNDVAAAVTPRLSPVVATNVSVVGTSTIKISCAVDKGAVAVAINRNKEFSVEVTSPPISGCN